MNKTTICTFGTISDLSFIFPRKYSFKVISVIFVVYTHEFNGRHMIEEIKHNNMKKTRDFVCVTCLKIPHLHIKYCSLTCIPSSGMLALIL